MFTLKSLPLFSRGAIYRHAIPSPIFSPYLSSPRFAGTNPTQRALLQFHIDNKRIRSYLKHLDETLTNRGHDENSILSDIRTKFSKHASFKGPLRLHAYENVILLLLSRRCFSDACATYEAMMSEGLVPRQSLQAKFAAVKAILAANSSNDSLEVFRKEFQRKEFNEQCLEALINLITISNNSDTVWTIVELFVESRGPEFQPSNNFVFMMGRLEKKFGTKNESPQRISKDGLNHSVGSAGASGSQSLETYVDIVKRATSSASDEDVSEAYQTILSCTFDNSGRVDFSALNALIAYDLSRQAYEQVFKLYNILMQIRSRQVLPDAHTYKLLFKAIKKIYNPRRSTRSRKHRRPPNVVPPRVLFKEMLECHLIHALGRATRKSHIVTNITLNAALRAFMGLQDYVAAFVTVKSFGVYGLRPDVQTYQAVIQPLLYRAKTTTDATWLGRLLEKGNWEGDDGYSEVPSKSKEMEVTILRRLLKIGVHGSEVTEGEGLKAILEEQTAGDEVVDQVHEKELQNFLTLMAAAEEKRAASDHETQDQLSKEELEAFDSLENILYAGSERSTGSGGSHSESKTVGEKHLAMLEAKTSDPIQSHGRLRRLKSYGIPTLAMLLQSTSPFPYTPKFFDITPLQRILRRVMFASLPDHQCPYVPEQTTHTPSSPPEPRSAPNNSSRSISSLIRLVKKDMIPQITSPDLRQKSRASIDRRDGSWRFMKVKPRR